MSRRHRPALFRISTAAFTLALALPPPGCTGGSPSRRAALAATTAPADATSTPGGTLRWSGADCMPELPRSGVWDTQVGYGQGATQQDAARAAAEDARARLLARLSRTLEGVQVDGVAAQIRTDFVPPAYEQVPGATDVRACAVAIVPEAALRSTDLYDGLAAMDAKLSERLREIVGPKPRGVYFRAPIWSSGPEAGELGGRLLHRLHGILARVQGRLAESASAADVEVVARLSPQAGGCSVVLLYQPRTRGGPGSRTWSVTRDVLFSPRPLGLRTCTAPPPSALDDDRLGLVDGERRGSGGQWVDLDVPVAFPGPCEGTQYTVRVRTATPSYVAVYSLLEDGRALAGWVNDRPTTDWSSPDPAWALSVPGPAGDLRDRMVAVAVPAASGAEALRRALPPAGCLAAPGAFSLERLPPEAAIRATGVSLVSRGRGDCSSSPEAAAKVAALRAALSSLPPCPVR